MYGNYVMKVEVSTLKVNKSVRIAVNDMYQLHFSALNAVIAVKNMFQRYESQILQKFIAKFTKHLHSTKQM